MFIILFKENFQTIIGFERNKANSFKARKTLKDFFLQFCKSLLFQEGLNGAKIRSCRTVRKQEYDLKQY